MAQGKAPGRLFGLATLRRDGSETEEGARGAHARGFDVARYGDATIKAGLDHVATAATGPIDKHNKALEALYSGLREYANEDDFGPYTAILRVCVLKHWPIASGEVVLGEVVSGRRLHSLVAASRDIGVGAAPV
jgi:hypothetical protein